MQLAVSSGRFGLQNYNPAIFGNGAADAAQSYNISCKWEPLRDMILAQWSRLRVSDIESIGPNRSKLAALIGKQYGIAISLVENYLRNFERTLPLI